MRWIMLAVLFSLFPMLVSCIAGSGKPVENSEKVLRKEKVPEELISSITERKELTYDEFRKFAEHKNHNVRYLIAVNHYTPKDVLTRLADDRSRFVRRGVSINPAIDRDLVDKLMKDKKIYDGLVTNPVVPEELLLQIYDGRKKAEFPITFFAQNPNCPERIIQDILASDDVMAKDYLRQNGHYPPPKRYEPVIINP